MRALCLLLALIAAPARADQVVVFAAASLKTALDQIAADFMATSGHDVVISYGGSNALAQQIIQGAPADVFFSAAENWMDAVDSAGLIQPGTRADVVGNQLVLVAHEAGASFGPGTDLEALLSGGKLAMAMVDSVPAGQYGKAALKSLGQWDRVEPHVVQTENVRAALVLVATGETPYGIVYASDALAEPAVTVVATFAADSHPPIRFPAALLTTAADPADRDFLVALQATPAREIFAAQGFDLLD